MVHRWGEVEHLTPEVNISSYSGARGDCLIFFFSCSYIQIRVIRAEILVRNNYA